MTELAATPLDYAAILAAIPTPSDDTPPPRAKDLAETLGVPEAALSEARRATGETRRLAKGDHKGAFRDLLIAVGEVGEVMALTRSDHCVHEKHGTYLDPEIEGPVGLFLGEIDLRLFLFNWKFAYAVNEVTRSGPRRSLQFFDGAGIAMHKIYETKKTDSEAFTALIERFADDAAEPAVFTPNPEAKAPRPDAEVDVDALRAAWAGMKDTHEFFGMLREHDVAREQAMRLAGREWAREVPVDSVRRAFEHASATGQSIMVFAFNRGCVQIHTGPVKTIKIMGPWLNVLDPRFNLHLREDRIASAWIVRKPGDTGDVHSLELFDKDGVCFVQLFGERKPGNPELEGWRALLAGLEAEPA